MSGGAATDSIARIEQLLEDAERLVDPQARALARSLAAAMVELVGAGMTRAIELGADARALADDELGGNLLVLCGMHPDTPARRAELALGAAKAALSSLGVSFDRVEAEGDGLTVRVAAERGEAPDAERVRAMVEAIVVSRAPDVGGVRVELGGRAIAAAAFVPLERLTRAAT